MIKQSFQLVWKLRKGSFLFESAHTKEAYSQEGTLYIMISKGCETQPIVEREMAGRSARCCRWMTLLKELVELVMTGSNNSSSWVGIHISTTIQYDSLRS